MLEICIGKQELKANNIVGIYGDTGTGKSYLMAQITYRLSMKDFCIRFLLLDGVMMQSLTRETKDKYIQAITSLADEYPAILIVDSLELLKDSTSEFYKTIKHRVNAGKWKIIYTSQEINDDFNYDNNILIRTTNVDGYKAEIVLPVGSGTENIKVASF